MRAISTPLVALSVLLFSAFVIAGGNGDETATSISIVATPTGVHVPIQTVDAAVPKEISARQEIEEHKLRFRYIFGQHSEAIDLIRSILNSWEKEEKVLVWPNAMEEFVQDYLKILELLNFTVREGKYELKVTGWIENERDYLTSIARYMQNSGWDNALRECNEVIRELEEALEVLRDVDPAITGSFSRTVLWTLSWWQKYPPMVNLFGEIRRLVKEEIYVTNEDWVRWANKLPRQNEEYGQPIDNNDPTSVTAYFKWKFKKIRLESLVLLLTRAVDEEIDPSHPRGSGLDKYGHRLKIGTGDRAKDTDDRHSFNQYHREPRRKALLEYAKGERKEFPLRLFLKGYNPNFHHRGKDMLITDLLRSALKIRQIRRQPNPSDRQPLEFERRAQGNEITKAVLPESTSSSGPGFKLIVKDNIPTPLGAYTPASFRLNRTPITSHRSCGRARKTANFLSKKMFYE